MSDLREPPREIELAELIEAAAEVDDPVVYRIIDIRIAKERAKRDAAATHAVAQNRGLRSPSPEPAA